MRNKKLIETLEKMQNGDAISDIQAFNDFVRDFLHYMEDMYDMEPDEVRSECGLTYMRDRR